MLCTVNCKENIIVLIYKYLWAFLKMINCEEIQNVIDVFSRVPVYLSVNLERMT